MRAQTIVELQIQIETLFTGQVVHLNQMAQSVFPDATFSQPSDDLADFAWQISKSVFLNYDEFAQKGLVLRLIDGQEAILVFEFGLSNPESQDICFRNLLLTCLFNSREFGDGDNPFLLMCSKEDWFWDTNPPEQAAAYVQLARQLFDALADWRFKPRTDAFAN